MPRALLASLLLVLAVLSLSSQQLEMTASYPSPSGIYRSLVTTGAATLARDGGVVTIGRPGRMSSLYLRGTLRIDDGSARPGYVLTTASESGIASWGRALPEGMIALFDPSGACPPNWEEVKAEGAFLRGAVPSGIAGKPAPLRTGPATASSSGAAQVCESGATACLNLSDHDHPYAPPQRAFLLCRVTSQPKPPL